MANLYSLQGRDPEPLPEKVRLLDSGLTVRIGEEPDQEILAAAGWTGPYERPQDFDQNTHKCVWSPDDLSFVVLEKSKTELRLAKDSALAQLRVDRNHQLDQTDKLVMPWVERGLPVPEALIEYRQALRDLPATAKDPFMPGWPVCPKIDRPEASQQTESEQQKPRQPRRRKTT